MEKQMTWPCYTCGRSNPMSLLHCPCSAPAAAPDPVAHRLADVDSREVRILTRAIAQVILDLPTGFTRQDVYQAVGNAAGEVVTAALAQNERLRERNASLLRATANCAIPYEALLSDEPSRKWVAPAVWKAMVKATTAVRALLREAP